MSDQSFWADAVCAQTDPEAWFPDKGESPRTAKDICTTCPIQQACLDYALANDIAFGVWGGLTTRERRLLTHRPANDTTTSREPAA